jgi:hypothetical protein
VSFHRHSAEHPACVSVCKLLLETLLQWKRKYRMCTGLRDLELVLDQIFTLLSFSSCSLLFFFSFLHMPDTCIRPVFTRCAFAQCLNRTGLRRGWYPFSGFDLILDA